MTESSFLKVGHAFFAVEFTLLIKKTIASWCFCSGAIFLTASCLLTLDGLIKVLWLHNYWFPQHVLTALFLAISIRPPQAKVRFAVDHLLLVLIPWMSPYLPTPRPYKCQDILKKKPKNLSIAGTSNLKIPKSWYICKLSNQNKMIFSTLFSALCCILLLLFYLSFLFWVNSSQINPEKIDWRQ